MSVYKKSELLKNHRVEKGFSREKLSEGICDSTTLKRYENEGMIPSDDNYRMLQEKMGGRPEQIIMSYDLGLFVDEDRYQEYEVLITDHKYDELQMKMQILKEGLKKTESVEKEQFLGRLEFILNEDYSEESLKKREELLKKSVPDYDRGDFSITRLYNDTELYLLNDIAVTYDKMGDSEKAIEVFRKLYTYIDQAEDNKDSLVVVKILFNFANVLGVNERYEESIEICRKSISLIKKNSCQEMMYTFVFNIGWLYSQMWKSSKNNEYKEKAEEYVELSLELARYFNESAQNISLIEAYRKEQFS